VQDIKAFQVPAHEEIETPRVGGQTAQKIFSNDYSSDDGFVALGVGLNNILNLYRWFGITIESVAWLTCARYMDLLNRMTTMTTFIKFRIILKQPPLYKPFSAKS
jgi:hypothetical protein